ncbi:hypothetical protein CVS40_12906 [Lucilia cuprina]|nr:hypothetical protein CVS40_12906 [Lucilia cuprina]
MNPRKYIHLGLMNLLEHFDEVISNENELVCDIGIDGLPLFKSTTNSLWPILGHIINLPHTEVFLIGVYLARKKPESIDEYLNDFVEEVKILQKDGVVINQRKINFKLRAFICDTPAWTFVFATTGYTSYHGCSKCNQVGKRVGNSLTYSTSAGLPRIYTAPCYKAIGNKAIWLYFSFH